MRLHLRSAREVAVLLVNAAAAAPVALLDRIDARICRAANHLTKED